MIIKSSLFYSFEKPPMTQEFNQAELETMEAALINSLHTIEAQTQGLDPESQEFKKIVDQHQEINDLLSKVEIALED